MQVAMEKFLLVLIIFIACAVSGILGTTVYYSIQASKSPTFTLYKNQWKCTVTTSYYTTTTILVGKVIVPQTRRVTKCINYQRHR